VQKSFVPAEGRVVGKVINHDKNTPQLLDILMLLAGRYDPLLVSG
jgi:hypothetical protein